MNFDPFAAPEVDPLEGLAGEPTQENTPPTISPQAARRTAQLAALAQLGASDEAGSVFESMDAKADAYLHQIEALGDDAVRREVAAQRQSAKLDALSSVLTENLGTGDEELIQGAAAAWANLSQLDAAEERNYALEQQAIERVQSLAASGDVTQARLMLSNLEHGNALDVIRDYNAKQQILQSALERMQVEQQDQPWFRDLADFALSVIPMYGPSHTGNVDVADTVKNWYDSLFSGERFRNEADALWDMPVAEMAEFVNGDFLKNLKENADTFGYTNRTEMLDLMTGLTERTPSAFETNAWVGLDVGGFVPWTKAMRLGGSIPSMMVRTGARREAAELTARAALDVLQDSTEATARSGMTVDNVANNLQVSAVAPEGTMSRVPIADRASAAIERGRELLERLPRLLERARLNAEELEHALSVETQRLERAFGREVKDVRPVTQEFGDGSRTHRIEFTLGKKNGDGFASEAMANRYLASIGEAGTAFREGTPTSAASQTSERMLVRDDFLDADGKLDMVAAGQKAAAEAQATLDNGGRVFAVHDGKEIEIVRVSAGRMYDANKNQYGIVPLISPTKGKTGGLKLVDASTASAIQDESGQWFARAVIDVPETGFYSNLLNVKTPSPWRFLLNSRNVGDIDLANAGQAAGNARNKLLRTLVEPYSDTFRSLRPKERDAVAQVLQAGETNAVWFTRDQIEALYQRRWNRAPTERELRAYTAARDINDMEYYLRNVDLYKQRVTKGYRTVSLDTGRGVIDRANAIIDRELKEIPKARVFDVSAGRHYVGDLTERQWKRMKGSGYQLITTENAVELADGTRIKNFLVKGKDVTVENLRLDQIAYRPGGHRMYRGQYFVKQTVKGVQPDTGKEFLDNPNVYIAAETKAEAEFWARRMEAAREAYNRGAGLDVIDEILGGHAGLPDAEEFVRLMDDPKGAFQKDTQFGVYFDREMPDEYVKNPEGLEFVDLEDTGFNGLLRTQGRMYTGRKGDQLPDYMGNAAPLLDPFQTIDRSLMNIASLSSFGDYKIQAVERWMKTFGPDGANILDVRDLPRDASNMRIFMEAPIAKGGNDAMNRVRSAALAQRQIIKRTLGWKTENDLRAEQWGRHLGEWVQGSRVDGIVPNFRKTIAVDWWRDTNPISALRSFAFDLKLGLGNFAQLPLQLSTAVAAVALSPKRGMQGWAMIAPMRFVLGGRQLTKEAFEARLDELVKRKVPELGGFKDGREFKEFARIAMRSGFFDLGGTHGLMDHYGASAALDGFQSGAKRAREAGRFFFFEAERWNRIVAWRVAWDEAKESGLKVGSPEFLSKLQGRAEEYSFNMSRESQAWWQKGFLSIPTQFWAYNMRMMEAMTVGNFTPAQKLRLVAAQSLLYGSAGLPVTGFVSEMLKSNKGEAPDIESFWGTADRGLLDRFIYSTTGADVLMGERYGTGNWSSELVRNIFGMSQYGEVSAADLLGGATFSIMGKLGKDVLRPVVEYMAAESGDTGMPIRREALYRLVSNVSTVGNYLKARMVWNYGTYRSNNGSTLITDLPSQTAVAVLFSIQPAEMDAISAMSSFEKHHSQAVKEAAKVITNYRVDMLNRPDQRETIMEEVNAFVQLLPPDIRRDALERVDGQIDPSLYDSLVQRLEERKAEEELNGLTD